MELLRKNVRLWWQIPRRLADREEDRSVTFLELFYDLVYVVLVAELAHALAGHVNWAGVGQFAFLFVIVWWAWFNGSTYHDIHGNNDIRTRVFTFLQMGTVASMAVFAHNAIGEGSVGFALSYAAFQFILLLLWWRSGVHDPAHRPLSRPYSFIFLIATLLFVGSVFIPEPIRYYIWVVAVALPLMTPFYTFSLGQNDPAIQEQIRLSTTASPSLVERFGLLTIIVLGEVIVGTVQGVAEHDHLNWTVGITAVLGMLIAIGLWWFYFDAIAHHLPRSDSQNTLLAWSFLHLPMTMGIVVTGAAVLNVVENAGEPLPAAVSWLLVSGCALVLVIIVMLMSTIHIADEHQPIYARGRVTGLIAAALIGLLGFTNLGTIPLLIAVVVLLLMPVIYSIMAWIEMAGNAEQVQT